MADAYKGLTIRIGAETTGLSKALKSANSAISKTKGELTKLKRALKFDPSSAEALTAKMAVLSEQGAATANKITMLKDATRGLYRELTGKELSPEMDELAEATKEAATNAANAKARYNNLIETVASVKNKIQELSGIDDFWEQSASDIRTNLDAMESLGGEAEELVVRYRKLSGQVGETQAQLEKMNKIEQLGNLRVDIIKTEAELKKIASDYVKVQEKQALAFSGSNVNEYRSQIKQLSHTTDTLSDEFNELRQAAQLDPKNINVARAAVRNLHEQSDIAADKVKLLSKELREVESASGIKATARNMQDIAKKTLKAREEAVKWQTELQKIKSELSGVNAAIDSTNRNTAESVGKHTELVTRAKQLKTAMSEVQVKADAAMRELEAKEALAYQKRLTEQISIEKARLNELQGKINETKTSWTKMYSNLTSVGMTAYATITPIASNFIASSIEDAKTLDVAYRNMRKTVEGSEEQFEELRDAAIEFSNTHVTTASQILEIEALGGQLGIAADDLKTFADTVANLDIATNIDAETAAVDLGQLSSIMDFTADEFDNFADSLVRLGNNEPTLESNIMDITSRIGSQASILGMSADQVLAYSTAVAATGQNSEAAGTALSNTMAQIESAVSKGGDALDGFAEVSGMSSEEFAKAWETDAAGALQSFIEGLKKIDDNGGSVETTLEDLGINAVRQKQALSGLTKTTDVLSDSLVMSKDAWNGVSDEWGAAGDAAREAEKKSEGFSGTLSSLENVFSNIKAEIADGLTPVLGGLRDVLQVVYDATSNMTDTQKDFVLVLMEAAAVSGPLLTAMGSVGAALDRMREGSNVAKNTFAKAAKEWVKKSGSIQDAVETTADIVDDSGSAWVGLSDNMDNADRKTKALDKSMKVLKGTSVLVAAVIGTIAVSALVEYFDHQEKAKKATDGLSDSVAKVTGEFESQSGAAENSQTSISDYSAKVKELTDSQAALADKIADSYTEASANISMLDQAKATIKKYGDTTNLTAQEVGELESAVDLVNDKLGSSYKVVSKGNAYKILDEDSKNAKGSILELIETQEKQLKLNALQEVYSDTYKKYYENVQLYEEGLSKVQEKEKQIKDLNATISEQGFATPTQQALLMQYRGELDSLNGVLGENKANLDASADATKRASDRYAALSTNTDTASGKLLNWIANNDEAWTSMQNSQGSAQALADQLANVGIKSGQLKEIDWSVLSENFDGTFASISGDLSKLNVDFDENKAKALNHQQGLSIAFAKIASNSGLATSNVLNNMGKQVGGINGLAKAFSDAGVSVEDLANLTDDQLAQIVSDYETSGADIKKSVSDAAKNVSTTAPTLGKAIPEGLLSGMRVYNGEASNYMTEESEKVINAVRNVLDINSPSRVMMGFGMDTMQGFADGLTLGKGAVTNSFENVFRHLSNGAFIKTSTFVNLGKNAMSKLGAGITANKGIPVKAINKSIASVTKTASSGHIAKSLSSSGKSMMTSLAQGVTAGAGKPKSAVKSAITQTTNQLRTFPNSYKSAGSRAMTQLASGIHEGAPRVKSRSTRAVSDAKSAANRSAQGFDSVGRNAMRGFAKGITDNDFRPKAAAKAAARKALEAANKALDVGSPSKEFAKTGMYAMQGFAIGFEDEQAATVRSVKSTMRGVLNGAQSYLDTTSLSFSPEIAGDLSSDYSTNVSLSAESAEAIPSVYNLYLNDLIVNGDEEIQAQVYDLIKTLLRKGDM